MNRCSNIVLWKLINNYPLYVLFQDVCRRIFCPLFHFLRDNKCYPVYNGTRFTRLPKLATVMFQELNKTEKLKDPYQNFKNDVLPIVNKNILKELLGVEFPTTWKFYQKEGAYESDFILLCFWSETSEQELVPEIIRKLFNKSVVSMPFQDTSGSFEVKLFANLHEVGYGNTIIINGSTFNLIFFHKDNAGHGIYDSSSVYSLAMNRLLLCNRIVLDRSEFNISEEYIFLQSQKAIRLTDAHIITSKGIHLCIEDYLKLTENRSFPEAKTSILQEIAVIVSFICSTVSILCLLITILTYILLKPLRTIPGKINLCLCVSLLMAQILQQFTMDLTQYPTACIVFGGLIHFFWAVTLFWMNIASLNLFRCFSPANITAAAFQPSLLLYAVYVIGMSLLLVGANLGYSFWTLGRSVGYGGHICYISSFYGLLITFVSPVGLIIISNLCFLLVTIWRISRTPKPQGTQSVDRSNVLVYIKMSTLTGTCWIFGFLRLWTEFDIFELLFILTNASQGLFLMLSFVCNKRILNHYKELIWAAS